MPLSRWITVVLCLLAILVLGLTWGGKPPGGGDGIALGLILFVGAFLVSLIPTSNP